MGDWRDFESVLIRYFRDRGPKPERGFTDGLAGEWFIKINRKVINLSDLARELEAHSR